MVRSQTDMTELPLRPECLPCVHLPPSCPLMHVPCVHCTDEGHVGHRGYVAGLVPSSSCVVNRAGRQPLHCAFQHGP